MENTINNLSLIGTEEINRINGERDNFVRSDAWIEAVRKATMNLIGGIVHTWHNGELFINSASGGRIYVATRNTCTCPAFVNGEGRPCWHRSAWTLVNKAYRINRIFTDNGSGY